MPDAPTPPREDGSRYSAEALAIKHGIPVEQARELLARARIVPPIEEGDPNS